MQGFAIFYCRFQEDNKTGTGRVFIISNKLQVLKIFCKELWIQKLKIISKIYHLWTSSASECWHIFVERMGWLLVQSCKQKNIFSLFDQQKQRFDFSHLLQRKIWLQSFAVKSLLWQICDLKHCWKFCWDDQSNILSSFDQQM